MESIDLVPCLIVTVGENMLAFCFSLVYIFTCKKET